MSKPENDTPVEIEEDRLDEVSGGPIYMSNARNPITPSMPSAIPDVNALGDGSVKVGG